MTTVGFSIAPGVVARVVSPAPRDRWQQLMAADAGALPYQSPEWFEALLAVKGYTDVSRMYEMADGRFLILPLVRHPLLPLAFSPPPGWGMGGLLASEGLCSADITAVFADLAYLPWARISIRPNPQQGALWESGRPAWVTAVPRYAHMIDLSRGFDHIWQHGFGKKMRKFIRQAEKNPRIVTEWDDTGRLLPVFYDLLLQSFDRWSAKQHEPRWLTHWRGKRRDPLSKFEVIADRLGQVCRVYVAWVDGKPAASSITLQGRNVNDSRGAMNRELVGQTGANYLIQKLAIEEAAGAGCRFYHLGESGRSSNLAQFKERFGAVGHPYAEYHVEKLPVTKMDAALRGFVKQLIGFKDV